MMRVFEPPVLATGYTQSTHAMDVAKVSMRQARLLFLSEGILDAVQSAIDSLPEPQRSAVQIEWEYAAHIEKDSPIVTMMAEQIGASAQDVEQWFIQASQL